MNESLKDRIFDAAMTEMLSIGLDDFSLKRVASRAEVDRELIAERWHDRRVLLMEAMLSRATDVFPMPDTGSLRGDLQAIADSWAAIVATPEGRKWFHRLIPHGRDADLYEVGPDFWEIRFNAVVPVLQRAAQRGELREDINPDYVIRTFAAACGFDLIFGNSALRPDLLAQTVDIFVRGITC